MARTRREEYSDASRRALIDSARERFAATGFANTSLDEIAARARLTKGAVYHHFANKQALFQAVLSELQSETVAAVTGASDRAAAKGMNSWEAGLAGLDTFLDRCLDPVYQRICFLEGPLAVGFTTWWENGEENEIALIKSLLASLQADGLVDTDDIDTLTTVLFGGLVAAALSIARSNCPVETKDRVRQVVVRTIWGLRPVPAPVSARWSAD